MYIEKRISDKNIKYYLVYSYRDVNNKVKKIRKYLGLNLSKKEIKETSKNVKKIILDQLKNIKNEIFDFSLTKKQISSLNNYDDQIKIIHLTEKDWQKFTEKFVYNTNAIEGSTIPEKEVPFILKSKIMKTNEEIETKGVANAINYIRKTEEDLSIKLILRLHKLCFKGSKSFAGKLRDVEVIIKDGSGKIIHSGTLVKNLKKELDEFISWYNKNKNNFKPLVLAAIVHNQFEDIHPFQDGNGRVGRLLLNFILIKNNYPPINILLQDRLKYYNTLQEYQNNDKLKPTLNFLIKQYQKKLN